MPRKLIFIFPGQASQYVGMGRDFYDNSPAAGNIMDQVTAIDGLNHIADLCFEGPEELLTRTDNVQPAITTVSLMALAAITEMNVDLQCQATAGHSLGEYAAHAAAGNLTTEQTLHLVTWRGRWMNEASQPPHPEGAMVAIMGMTPEQVEQIAAEVGADRVAVANFNSPGQIILSGEKNAIEKASVIAKETGARKCILLKVSGAWHSPLMRPAKSKMAELLGREITPERVSLSTEIPVVANATAEVVSSVDTMRETLTAQVTSPVRWEACVKRLVETTGYPGLPSSLSDDIREQHEPWPLFVELGPGKVLKGLLKSIDRKLEAVNVGDMAGIQELESALN